MSKNMPRLSIGRVLRKFSNGGIEELNFEVGVNVLVGRPNVGKTKWLQTIDFLFGDPGDNPFAGAQEAGLDEKFNAAGMELIIGDDCFYIERRWKEIGSKTKIFVDNVPMAVREFQQWLMKELSIPLLHFPKGNPMSGQTWPELSFRMLLRHIYRQQRFWSDLADKQPEGEQHACIMQFLGLAEHIFTDDYGQLVELKLEVERLKTSRKHYDAALEAVAHDVLTEAGFSGGVSKDAVIASEKQIAREINLLRQRRAELLASNRDKAIPAEHRNRVAELGEERAFCIAVLEERQVKLYETEERISEMTRYRADLSMEFERLDRAADAGRLLADLKITHCPACDQTVHMVSLQSHDCFLCHQRLPNEPEIDGLGAVRIKFERDRLSGETLEADELLKALHSERQRLQAETVFIREKLQLIENELAPSREAVSALVQGEISALDVALGQVSERQRQIARFSSAAASGEVVIEQINKIEKKIAPLQARVDEAARATDFDSAGAELEEGINTYLVAINELKPGVWRHSPVRVDISKTNFNIKVGARRWSAVLGGTDTLYFLMAYQYGLLALSSKNSLNYPGLMIIDVPGEFSGEAIEDKENFIVQPFIDLLSSEKYQGCQLIITGASFSGLMNVKRQELNYVHIA